MEAVKINYTKVGKLFFLVLPIPACVFFYYLFFSEGWWMFFSCFFAFFIELFFVGGATDFEAKLKQSDLIVSSSELPKYISHERVTGFVLLGVGVLLTLLNLVPFFAMNNSFVKLIEKVCGIESYWGGELPILPVYEGGVLVSVLVIGVIFLSWMFLGPVIESLLKNANVIEAEYNSIIQKKRQEKNDGIAKTIEYSTHTFRNGMTDKSVYLICDAKSRMFVSKIINDIKRVVDNNCDVVLPVLNEDENTLENLISQATVVLCYVDANFVKSTTAMKELMLASNLNKTIFAALTKNIDSDTHSNISKYVRREFYRLDSMPGYNDLFSDLYPILGCNEPLASSIGDRYEFEIISMNGFSVKIDDNIFNFDAGKKICMYFHTGSHVLTFCKKGKSDLSIVRTLTVTAKSSNSKFLDKHIKYNLDALVD